MNTNLSRHAKQRMTERGIDAALLNKALEHADIERPAIGNCRLYRVTKRLSKSLGDERLSRFAVIWSDDTAQVVTVVLHHEGQAGAIYRRRTFPKPFRRNRRRQTPRQGWVSSVARRRNWS